MCESEVEDGVQVEDGAHDDTAAQDEIGTHDEAFQVEKEDGAQVDWVDEEVQMLEEGTSWTTKDVEVGAAEEVEMAVGVEVTLADVELEVGAGRDWERAVLMLGG